MSFLISRLPALKFITVFGGCHLGLTLLANFNSKSVMTIQEYIENQAIESHSEFTIIGMLKPNSIKLLGGMNKRFVVTDSHYDIICKFNGNSDEELKEGETAILTGYCPNIEEKENIVVSTYQTNHSMETKDWDAKNNLKKKSYGLESFK